jgi:hypothetical protein
MWELADITGNLVDRLVINTGDDKTSSYLFDSYSDLEGINLLSDVSIINSN